MSLDFVLNAILLTAAVDEFRFEMKFTADDATISKIV